MTHAPKNPKGNLNEVYLQNLDHVLCEMDKLFGSKFKLRTQKHPHNYEKTHTLPPVQCQKMFEANVKKHKGAGDKLCKWCCKLYGANASDQVWVVPYANVTTTGKYTIVELVLVIIKPRGEIIRRYHGLATKSPSDKQKRESGVWLAFNRAFESMLESINCGV